MIDQELVLMYYGPPPHYRNVATNTVMPLPFSVRMPDGSLRTDSTQWRNDPAVLAVAGFEATEVTQADIDAVAPKLADIRERKVFELQNLWESAVVATGYITPEGWRLGLTTADVALLTGAFLLLKESTSLGLAETTTIIDMDGSAHAVTLSEMTTLMLQYGQFRSEKSQQYANKLQEIAGAATIAQLNAINLVL